MSAFGWVCFGIVAVPLAVSVLAIIIMSASYRAPDDSFEDHEKLPCPRCSEVMLYKIRLPSKIRCSCGNIMPVPLSTPRKVSCPGCLETIHVTAIRKPTRVRCKCGNVARIT